MKNMIMTNNSGVNKNMDLLGTDYKIMHLNDLGYNMVVYFTKTM